MQRNQSSTGSRIREIRQQQGISVRRLAAIAFVNPSTVSRLERGKTRCNEVTIAQVARSLSVAPTEIDPNFNQKVMSELESIEADLERVKELQSRISELQSSISNRQRMLVSCLLA